MIIKCHEHVISRSLPPAGSSHPRLSLLRQLPDDKCTQDQGLHHKAPVTIQASVLVLIQQKGVTISLSFD